MQRLDNHGATLIEYALVVSLITITAIASMRGLSNAIGGRSNSVSSKVTGALGGEST